MKIDGSLARNIDSEVANLEVPKKTPIGENVDFDLKLYTVSKFEEASHERIVLLLPRVSSRVSGFPAASPCLWGKLQNISFSKVSNCENWKQSRTKCSFFCAHASRLESLVFPVASPCLWGKLQNLSFSKVAMQVVMSFCVAGAALCDIPTCFRPCRKCQN